MTVQELIELLQKAPDKTALVLFREPYDDEPADLEVRGMVDDRLGAICILHT